jgi:two-component system sensor histidine kinase DesK
MSDAMWRESASSLMERVRDVAGSGRVSRRDTGASWSATSAGLSRYIWLLWVIWLSFFAYPIQALSRAHPAPLRVAVVLAGAAAFAALYVWNIVGALRSLRTGQSRRSPWPALVTLAAVALALTLGDRRDWVELFIFVAVSLGPSLPPRQALAGVATIVLLTPILGTVVGATGVMVAQMMFQTAVSGLAVIIVTRTIVLDRELREARGEIARLAVSEERLRFARDLHDLLGHSLSLIALKSELAAKLAAVAPDRAAVEMQDVEAAARTALQEVRDAVAGYRQPSLSGELESAGEVLAAAGIELSVQGALPGLPVSREAVLAWAVREGVTNVIKHSRARHCTITLRHAGSAAELDVVDDGPGSGSPGAGSGLMGLRERLGRMGGTCDAGPAAEGGFRLSVCLPLEERQPT